MSAYNDESKWSFCNLNGKGVLSVAHRCWSLESVWSVAITSTQPAVLFGLHHCQAARKRSRSLHEMLARCQSNSATCADIKHYCKLTFHMDCNSAFLRIATESLKKTLCLCSLGTNLAFSSYIFPFCVRRYIGEDIWFLHWKVFKGKNKKFPFWVINKLNLILVATFSWKSCYNFPHNQFLYSYMILCGNLN